MLVLVAGVARWLRVLEFLGIIHLAPGEVRRRGGNRSPRYNYGLPMRNTVGFSSVKEGYRSDSELCSTQQVRPILLSASTK